MEYIDLGLPSGNLWAAENEEGYYTFDEAVAKFWDNLPTKEDFEELVAHCWKRWDDERKGMEFMGDNGKKLFLPVQGYHVGKSEYHFVSLLKHQSESYNDSTRSITSHFYRKGCVPIGMDAFAVRLIKRGGTK